MDERDGNSLQVNDVPYCRGLTEFVLRTGQAQLIDARRFLELQQSGDITQASGDLSFTSWLGVPMLIRGDIGGVLAVQTYDEDKGYRPIDADILTFVANHFSSAIERYQAIDELRESEKRYRTLIEKIGLGVIVIQGERVVFANPSMEQIAGHPLDYLLSHPYNTILHPDDVPAVMAHYARRQSGNAPEAQYTARILTEQGETRWLEFSAIGIEWNKRPATLLFAIDASERQKADQVQREALKKQTELNAMKSSFISMASHEFRTPLATIHGSVELLRHYDTRLSVSQKSNSLHKIEDAVQRMTQMLEKLLLIGTAESGRLGFNPKAVALSPLCHAILEDLRSSMSARFAQVRLELDLPPPDQKYWLDETLLRHMLGNLLSNALKYTPAGGQVKLTAQSDGEMLSLTVTDQGIGIPAADLPHLFENFHRASNVGLVAGTGLGLSIVKDAVTSHHGQLDVQSEAGQGSCFNITLPTGKLP